MKPLFLGAAVLTGCGFADLASGATTASSPSLLPSGYLITSGNQIIDLSGHNVRLACTGYVNETSGIAKDVQGMKADGFNCIRIIWYDETLAANLNFADQVVAAASAIGMKVILDHHGDEKPTATNDYLPQPANGLPIDEGPGTDGTDGSNPPNNVKDIGHVNLAKFISDWVTVAQHYAGNSTVIGFDLTNEPKLDPTTWMLNPGGATWNIGAPTDLRIIYEEAGDAIQKVNSGPLIIAEGILNNTDNLLNNDKNTDKGYGDLSMAGTSPVQLTYNDKLVYSIHDYPSTIGGTTLNGGSAKIAAMNASWGYLVADHTAPVWIGEMGASLDNVGTDSTGSGELSGEQAWVATLVTYVNGRDGAEDGPSFTGCQQPVDTDWWAWGNLDKQQPDGTLDDNGKPRVKQKEMTNYLEFIPAKGC